MTKIRVNIRSVVNHASVREELDVNGRMCIVVPSKTLPDDVVMNDIKYQLANGEKWHVYDYDFAQDDYVYRRLSIRKGIVTIRERN